ncbi:hypothetical protein M501DRAFT_584739 [Patellaria atrata CBS 101060]|uniref:Uncharacterized protein n=1 Tax=Patellaria atrata CBS 101060 TaxID=1346257 RepID=A0A9P4VS58_9PEZI|nr:hypothetical protein M501DRAFT_584739 [Patellaria atrata CBS 101060]
MQITHTGWLARWDRYSHSYLPQFFLPAGLHVLLITFALSLNILNFMSDVLPFPLGEISLWILGEGVAWMMHHKYWLQVQVCSSDRVIGSWCDRWTVGR